MLERARQDPELDSFDSFFRVNEPLLRRALVAGFGGDAGRDATAQALEYAWRNWSRVRQLDHSVGYLYRLGERWARRHRRRLDPVAFFRRGASRKWRDLLDDADLARYGCGCSRSMTWWRGGATCRPTGSQRPRTRR